MEGWVGLIGRPIVDTLPTKWSHVNHSSLIDRGKFTSQDRHCNDWVTPPVECVLCCVNAEYGKVLDFRINRKTGGTQAGNNVGQKVGLLIWTLSSHLQLVRCLFCSLDSCQKSQRHVVSHSSVVLAFCLWNPRQCSCSMLVTVSSGQHVWLQRERSQDWTFAADSSVFSS